MYGYVRWFDQTIDKKANCEKDKKIKVVWEKDQHGGTYDKNEI